MSLLFCDSFDHYATADILDKWTSIRAGSDSGTWTVAAEGRTGSCGKYQCGGALSRTVDGLVFNPGGTRTSGIAGGAFKYSDVSLGHANGTYLIIVYENNDWHVAVRVSTDGTLQVIRNGGLSGDTVLGTSSTSFPSNAWTYVELEWTIHDSTGAVALSVNGLETLSVTGVDTRYGQSGVWTSVQYWGNWVSGYPTLWLDDVYVLDPDVAPNDARLGDISVCALLPNGTGNSSMWTPSTGSNYTCADETTPNDDTDYVSTSDVSDKDTYAFQDAAAGATILGVQVSVAARKAAEGSAALAVVVRHSSADYDSSNVGVASSTDYKYCRAVYDVNPGTATAWSAADVTNAEFGFKKTV